MPTYLPDGVTLVEVFRLDEAYVLHYDHQVGSSFTVVQGKWLPSDHLPLGQASEMVIRGQQATLVTDLHAAWGDSSSCTWCGKCVAVCPTGSLSYQGSAVGEMEHSVAIIKRLAVARSRGEWLDPEAVT